MASEGVIVEINKILMNFLPKTRIQKKLSQLRNYLGKSQGVVPEMNAQNSCNILK